MQFSGQVFFKFKLCSSDCFICLHGHRCDILIYSRKVADMIPDCKNKMSGLVGHHFSGDGGHSNFEQ